VDLIMLAVGMASFAAVALGAFRIRQALGDRDIDGALTGAVVVCAGMLAVVTLTDPGLLGGLQ
jgi:hypothetical protein